jgi:glucokinase
MNGSSSSEYFAGVDVGGTKTRIGLVARHDPGRVAAASEAPTLKDNPEATVSAIALSARNLLPANSRLLAVGVGAPGPLDMKQRRPGPLPNLPAWRGYPLCEALESQLGAPVALDNDANVAAYGEMAFGAGRSIADFIFVTLGTGIGGALISSRRLVSGALGGAGEIGHIQVDPDGVLCGCGRRGCVETLASGPAIEREYGMPASGAFAAALRGDVRARAVLDAAGRALGAGLAVAATLLEPQAGIFGGGMSRVASEALAFYLGPCHDEMERRAYRMWGQDIPFRIAEKGSDGPVFGAALMARERWDLGLSLPPPGTAAGEVAASSAASVPSAGRLYTVDKPWGNEVWWAHTSQYLGKRILVRAGQSLSLQYHMRKLESMYFECGEGSLVLGERSVAITPGLSVTIEPGTSHRVIAETDVVFYEASTPEVNDVVRLEDRYGRV